MRIQKNYALVLYQAGANVHIDDPLRGRLNSQQMQERDANIIGAFIGMETLLV